MDNAADLTCITSKHPEQPNHAPPTHEQNPTSEQSSATMAVTKPVQHKVSTTAESKQKGRKLAKRGAFNDNLMPPISENYPTLIRLFKNSKKVVEVRCIEPGCRGNWRPFYKFLKGGLGLREHYIRGHPAFFRKHFRNSDLQTIVQRSTYRTLTKEQLDGINAGLDGAYLVDKVPVSGDQSRKRRQQRDASVPTELEELGANEGAGNIVAERLRARTRAVDLSELSDDEEAAPHLTNNSSAVNGGKR